MNEGETNPSLEKKKNRPRWGLARKFAATAAVLALIGTTLLLWRGLMPRPERMSAGKFPEQLVYVRTQDDIVDSGALFTTAKDTAKPIAIILIHGWGVNFYEPTYVAIGRALGERGYACIAGNTRMHDLGNVEGYRRGKRIRGGGYWGVASQQARDLAAWIDFAEARGFKKVVLVGHSAGAAAVREYQAGKQDGRVVGVVLASGGIYTGAAVDSDQVAQATRLMASGEGDALVRDPKRSFPSYISAATLLDIANPPSPEFNDFFGIRTTTTSPPITRIRCPLLAFFGTRGDVGGEKELELLKSCIRRQPGPGRVDTVMVRGADHMYAGEEGQVADTIADWADTLLQPEARRGGTPVKP